MRVAALLLVCGAALAADAAAPQPSACQLVPRKEALASASPTAFEGLEYQAACASVGAKLLASADPVERAAAAAYGEHFKLGDRLTVKVPIVSDIFGAIPLWRKMRFFSLNRAQVDQILARAPEETEPSVLIEQLRHFGALAGADATLKLLRASPLVASNPQVQLEAQWVWKQMEPKRLLPSELEAGFGLSERPSIELNAPKVDRSAERRQRVEAALARLGKGQTDLTLFREASEVGLGDRVADAVVASASRWLDEHKAECFFFGPQIEAGSGHLPTLLRLTALMKRCDSLFHCEDALMDGLARTPDPQAAVLAVLPLLNETPKGPCSSGDALIHMLPADASPATYLAVARALDVGDRDDDGKPGSCLWRYSPDLIDRLAVAAGSPDPARKDEAIEALGSLGKVLMATHGGSELWRNGDKMARALAQARNEKAAGVIVDLVAADARQNSGAQWARIAEAAVYFIGGPQAEKRAAAIRRHR